MTRLGWTLAALLSHWRRHPMQVATLMIGLIAATALWSGVQAINAQARQSYDRAAAAFGGGRVAMLVPVEAETLPQALFAKLRRAGWPVSPVLEGRVLVGGVSLRLIGIEPLTLPRDAGPAAAVPRLGTDDLAAFLLPPGRTRVAPATLREIGAREGDTPALGDGMTLPPLAVAADLVPGAAVVDIAVAQRLLDRPGRVSRLLLGADDGPRAPLTDVAGEALRLVEAGSDSDLDRLTRSFHVNLTAFGLLSFVVGLFIVYSAIGLAFEQRLPVMRAIRACGVSTRGLTVALLAELVGAALVAGVIGCVCGYLIAALLLPDVAVSLRGLYGADVPGELTLTPMWWLAGIGMSAAGALAAAAHSLVKAQSLPLIATAHPDAWRQAQQRWLVWQGIAALGLAAVALGLVVFGDNLMAGFALLAAIMLAAALALPVALAAALRLGERAAGRTTVLARWVLADSRQQLSGLSLALMALLLALAVNIGVGTMVKSFSRSFAGWLDQRLVSDIYIRAVDAAQARAIGAFVAARPDVTAVLPTPRADTRIEGWPVEVLGFADHPTYRDHWPLIVATPTLWDDLRDGRAALVSEQLARHLNLAPGASLTLATPAGPLVLRVGGIYPDYGNPKGQIGIANATLFAHWRDAPDTRFSLRVAADAVPELVAELRHRFMLDPSRLIDQATLKRDSTAIFNRTFAVTASLNAFTLGVAGVALLTSLLTLGGSRLPQLAPLWAMGVTRRRLAWLDLAKTMMLALLTALLAIPLGLVVAWCLLAVVNVKAFGWRLPFHVFPDQIVQLLVVALAAALLAAALPMIRLSRMNPADLIRVFASER
jgi:putative ABC transport system permease protein